MAVRFIKDKLVNEVGEDMHIPYEILIQACLREKYDTLSIKDIIFEAVYQLTGETVVRNKYRESSLFIRIENEIQSDKNYQTAKLIEAERRALNKEPKTGDSYNRARWKNNRDKLLKKMHRR